jgi:hypothetical protein
MKTFASACNRSLRRTEVYECNNRLTPFSARVNRDNLQIGWMGSVASTRVLLVACGIVGVAAALVVIRAAPASAQSSGDTNPSGTVPSNVRELWREYPLNPTPPPPATPQPRADQGSTKVNSPPVDAEPVKVGQQSTEPNSASADPEPKSATPIIVVALALAWAATAFALLLKLLRARTAAFRRSKRRQVATRSSRGRTNRSKVRPFETNPKTPPATGGVDPSPQVQAIAPEQRDEPDPTEAGERSPAVKIGRSQTQREEHGGYAEVGEQVASVLAAAQQAAEEVRTGAIQDAERIRQAAEADAASTRQEAESAAEQTQRESEALRAEAEQYSREAREAADRYAVATRQSVEDEVAARRAESEEHARDTQRAAEERAREIEAAALERRRAIIEEAERSEERLEELLEEFQGMTSQLDGLVHARRAEGEDEAHALSAELAEELHHSGVGADSGHRR